MLNKRTLASADICSDKSCKYNKLVGARHTITDDEYMIYGGKKRKLHLGDIDSI